MDKTSAPGPHHGPLRLKDCVHAVTVELPNIEVTIEAQAFDGMVNRCVNQICASLKTATPQFSDLERSHLHLIFRSMLHTHKAIRDLIRHETKNPIPLNAMPLVRTQLEALYATCLIVEQPEWLRVYLKNGWKTLYIRYLLIKEQSRALPNMLSQLKKQSVYIDGFQQHSEVSDAERATIDYDELGIPMPTGLIRKKIPEFPTPGKLIRKLKGKEATKLLTRLYPEYRFLCSFVHASPNSRVLMAFFDKDESYSKLPSPEQMNTVFQTEIATPGLWLDLLSIVQCCTEFVDLYPADIELRRVLTEVWNSLIEKSTLGRIAWEIRSRMLLGAIG